MKTTLSILFIAATFALWIYCAAMALGTRECWEGGQGRDQHREAGQ